MSFKGDYLSFNLENYLFGISALDVLELNKNLSLTHVPRATPQIRGITNLRGQIVPVVDLFGRIGLDCLPKRSESVSIILRCTGIVIALLVDNVGEILSLEGETFEVPPNNFPPVLKELIVGVHKLPGQLLHIIDSQKIIVGLDNIRGLPFDNKTYLSEHI